MLYKIPFSKRKNSKILGIKDFAEKYIQIIKNMWKILQPTPFLVLKGKNY